jgi:AcrR family transcriptional regulator
MLYGSHLLNLCPKLKPMPAKKQVVNKPGNRQAAYIARHRSELIKMGQEVLAEIGPAATIEELSEYAQVSPTNIYKYFKNKEVLFSEALSQMWLDWVVWSYDGVPPGQDLEAVITTARKLFWIKQTHPLFAKVLHNTLANPAFIIEAVKQGGAEVFRDLANRDLLEKDEFEKRMVLWGYALAGILTAVHVSEELSPSEAEVALAIALSIWGVNEVKAKKLMSKKLVFAPVNQKKIV